MRVRAGVLIQVLFLLVVFTLVLEFYLFTTFSNQRNILSQTNRIKAELMADLALKKIDGDKKTGTILFTDASCFFESSDNHYILRITFDHNHGEVYQINRDKER
ncbi:competence type IV pilus minor pilin ComGG [Streptococcaceae bacterium ESL0687]|nr:competence type IV pilus minor pilin ComGG [Streptococcaceae bacterium ESL0687]